MADLTPLECAACLSHDFYTSRRLPDAWTPVRWARDERAHLVVVVRAADDLDVVREATGVYCANCHTPAPEVGEPTAPSEPLIVPRGSVDPFRQSAPQS